MARIITQILVGLMLFFGTVTLLPKAYIEFRAGKFWKSILSVIPRLPGALFFVYGFLLCVSHEQIALMPHMLFMINTHHLQSAYFC